MHSECKKYGFTSKSFGKGNDRAVCIFKRRRQRVQQTFYEFTPEEETLSRIEKYFRRFPPSKEEVMTVVGESKTLADGKNALSRSYSGKKEKAGGQQQLSSTTKGRPTEPMTAEHIQDRHQDWKKYIESHKGSHMMALRSKLPIAEHKDEILNAVNRNQVVLIAGETGCGKTTQVPQYLLEDCWNKGKSCRIMCTQPRRISATSVADRIAQERGESTGVSVGYTIRLDKKGGDNTPIMFCTNGIMLRMLTSSDESLLENITHIVVDEIHERDRFADFMLIIMRDVLPRYPDLRLILMSATLHEELFSNYFGRCPIIRVPGFTYPVKDFFLEDILRITGYEQAALRQLNIELGKDVRSIISRDKIDSSKLKALNDAIESAFRQGSDRDFEHLLELTGSSDTNVMYEQSVFINHQHPDTGATPLFCACFRGRGDVASTLLANGADPLLKAANGMSAFECAEHFGHNELASLIQSHSERVFTQTNITDSALALSHYQSNTDMDEVDLGLIEELLLVICGEKKHSISGNGANKIVEHAIAGVEQDANAILIFLPGWDEITRLKDALEQSRVFGNKKKYTVLPLHSMISPGEQRKVFIRPPRMLRKIILSTNIAETAITIDDVAVIIDSGRQKEKSFDPYTGVSTLQSGWISQASARQRKGRAGRCREGLAFHLYSTQRYDAFDEYQAPELMRTPLDEMSLQVKLFEREGNKIKIAEFLSKAVEPPLAKAVESAVKLLENIGALEEDTEELTLLGRHLASLPIPPMLGKMLLYGVLFNCLDPILTISCCLAYRDPWVLPANADGRRRASQVKNDMSARGSGYSDHLATVVAFNEWKQKSRMGDSWGYCNNNFLNNATMTMVDGMRSQLVSELVSKGFINSLEDASFKASKPDIVRAVIAAGLYPNVGRVAGNPRRDQKSKAAMLNQAGERVRIHPSSVNVSIRNDVDNQDDVGRPSLLVYDELTRGDNLIHVKSCTEVNPHPVILVSSHLKLKEVEEETPEGDQQIKNELSACVSSMDINSEGKNDHPGLESIRSDSFWETLSALENTHMILSVDGWIHYRMPAAAAIFFSILRQRLVSAFAYRARNPNSALPQYLEQCIGLISNIFHKDGHVYCRNDLSLSSIHHTHVSRKHIHKRQTHPHHFQRHDSKKHTKKNQTRMHS